MEEAGREILHRSWTYAAELTAEQAAVYDMYNRAATLMWNTLNESQLDLYRKGERIESQYTLGNQVTLLSKLPEFSGVPVTVLHGAVKQLSDAWKGHLKRLREKKRTRPPRFRSSFRDPSSLYWEIQDKGGGYPAGKFFTVISDGTRDTPAIACALVRSARKGKGPAIGVIRIRYHHPLPEDALINHGCLRRSGGKFFFTVQYETSMVKQPAADGCAGIDLGVVNTFFTSDGGKYDAPGYTAGEIKRLVKLKRGAARKRRHKNNQCSHDSWVTQDGRSVLKRGFCPPPGHPDHDCYCWKHSGRLKRDQRAIAVLEGKAAARRKAGSHMASRALAGKYRHIVIEDLDIPGMTKSAKGTLEEPGVNVAAKSGLNREILAGNWGQLRSFLGYKTGELEVVPAAYTSRTCPGCGHVAEENRPSQAVFRCVICGLSGHADIVAAVNVKNRSVSIAAAQAVNAQEHDPSGEPANTYATSVMQPREHRDGEPAGGEHSQAGQDRRLVPEFEGYVIPEAWGKPSARARVHHRRSGARKSRSRRNTGRSS